MLGAGVFRVQHPQSDIHAAVAGVLVDTLGGVDIEYVVGAVQDQIRAAHPLQDVFDTEVSGLGDRLCHAAGVEDPPQRLGEKIFFAGPASLKTAEPLAL